METLLLECAVRAILIATGTAVLLSVMRIKNVVARHRAWTGVMLFMLMLPLWTVFGYQVPIHVLSPIGEQSVLRPLSLERIPMVVTRTRDLSSAVSNRDERLQAVNWGRFVLGVYFLGGSVML